MPRWIVPLLIASTIIFILEYYAFQAVKTVTKSRIVRWVWLTIGILVYLNLLYVIFTTPSNSGQTSQFQMATGMMITILIPKIFILVVLLGEDIIRIFYKITSWLAHNPTQPIPGRRRFISQIALVLAAIPLLKCLTIFSVFCGAIIKSSSKYLFLIFFKRSVINFFCFSSVSLNI